MGNSWLSVFPTTRAWEQQEQDTKADEDDKKGGVSVERIKVGRKERSPNGLTIYITKMQ